jgi:hypothetical protein
VRYSHYGFNHSNVFNSMRYSDLIKKLKNLNLTPSLLKKLNIWSFLNLKAFCYKSTAVIYFFLNNLQKFSIKYLKFSDDAFETKVAHCAIVFAIIGVLFISFY